MVLTPVGAACPLPGLWHSFGWPLAKGILEGTGLLENVGKGHGASKVHEGPLHP